MNMDFILNTLVPIFLGVVASYVTWGIAGRRLPASHRVAIIGFPRSGKTSLIAALFEYYFRRGAMGKSIVARGEETIQRVNENIKQLELRKTIAPTTDQDVFAYRAEILANRRYKLEIGDFPGEDTVEFSEKYGGWLHSTPYFKWAMSADAFIFVVDFSIFLSSDPDEEVARQKSAFRAAWQLLREHHLDGSADLNSKLLFLVFTKVDLVVDLNFSKDRAEIYSASSDAHGEVDRNALAKASRISNSYFSDLIEYFSRESKNFEIIYTSVFYMADGERQGIPRLAAKVLPKINPFKIFGAFR